MKTVVLTCALFFPLATAFLETNPVVAWSSRQASSLDAFLAMGQGGAGEKTLSNLLSEAGDLCAFDAIIVMDQPGLHASDLRTLSPSSKLSTRLDRVSRSVQLPYTRGCSADSLLDAAESLARRCGAQFVHGSPGDWTGAEEGTGMEVRYVSLPGGVRRDQLDESISREIEAAESSFNHPLFILTGTRSSRYGKRQSSLGLVPQPFSFAPNSTTASDGILKRYQLLTPALIVSLLIAFFVILPIIGIGISALASIQSPLRLDAPKGPNSEKKNQ